MKYYVDAASHMVGDGSKENPFKMIQEAADIAVAGDQVLVYPGIYRENVDPKNGGKEDARITYTSVEPLKAVITGAEILTGWKKVDGNMWQASSNGWDDVNMTVGLSKYKVVTNLYEYLPDSSCKLITTETLGMAFEPEQYFENPDGSPIIFDRDYYGHARNGRIIAGPIA